MPAIQNHAKTTVHTMPTMVNCTPGPMNPATSPFNRISGDEARNGEAGSPVGLV